MITTKKAEGKVKGFRLTKTDMAVLELIAKRGFQTYGELREKTLNEYHPKYIWSRLKRLEENGYLCSVKSDCETTLGWRINPKRKEGKEILLGTGSQLAPKIVSYSSSFNHDLLLRKIEDKLVLAPAITKWIPEHELKKQLMERFAFLAPEARRRNLVFVPDALLEIKTTARTVKAALELELTRKNRRALYEKLERYVISPDYQFAFYIVKGESLIKELKLVYDTVMAKSLHVRVAKTWNGIYFAELEDVLTKGIHAKFDGRANSIAFAEIG